jgi:cation diffusion facilitator family transporter
VSRNCSIIQNRIEKKHAEKITLWVVIITLTTMAAEIVAGLLTGSMALLSDGIHMGTHAVALFITLMAYIITRKQQYNPKFSFGTGKVGILGGYTNSILLILAGVGMGYESIERILYPVDIHFNVAILVAVVGLVVNIFCAYIMSKSSDKNEALDNNHSHHHHDHNMRAAYLHVITDAMTSILAIIALLVGKWLGFVWADPLVGILGAIVVIKWAIGLIKQSGAILLDRSDSQSDINAITAHFNKKGVKVTDIHIWFISENERSLIISLASKIKKSIEDHRREIAKITKFEHITIEIQNL